MPEKRKQNDDWNRYSEQPEKNSSTHDRLLYVSWCENTVVPGTSRSEPPSTAARPAAKAPNSIAAVNENDSFAAAFLALSAAVLASAMASR